MKRILTLAICLGLASALAVEAKDNDKHGRKRGKREAKIARHEAKFERNADRGRVRAQNRVNSGQRAQVQAAVSQDRSVRSNWRGARNRNVTVTRRGPANYSWNYSEARRNHHRGVRRDRSWYRNHYNRFSLFAGGYYYFDRGYWYPAYGYDSAYSTYRFDEPIYGYNSLDPSQVIVNVQQELRREGYYRGSIDGLIGPMTRRALERYQRDRGLYVTRAIDGPTLAALGLT
ncbi:MAG: peptidoglycan-binding protein [Chthoniobacterales bacterium]